MVYPVTDLAKATALFTQFLGVEPYVSGGYYVGFKVGDGEIGLDPNGHRNGATGPISYYQVDDIKIKSANPSGQRRTGTAGSNRRGLWYVDCNCQRRRQ